MRIAAIDQGTTSTRVLLAGDSGARIIHSARHEQYYPHPGWVEHDPQELLRNIRACLAAVGKVDAIGLANQGESCLAWDAATGEALSPVIVWQDNRTADWLAGLRGAADEVMARAGLPLDAYFSASKFAWILREIPQARAALAAGRLRLGTTDAFFLERLTGVFATDVTTASRTALMNLATRQWDPQLCRIFGVPLEALPEIRESAGHFGEIAGVPVMASLVDQQAALYGHGCRAAGDAKITFGTGAFALALTGQHMVASGQGVLPTVAWSRGGVATYALEGGVYDAGAAVEWGARLGLFDSLDDLHSFESAPAISRNLAFVPALSGLACPHWDRTGAALWVGMDAGTTRRDMAQALLEGIALRTAEVVAAMDALVPLGPRISVDGGLTRSAYFVQFLANALQRDILRPAFDELTAFGCAAMAAGRALTLPGAAEVVTPNVADVAGWHEIFAKAVGRAKGWR